MSTYRKKLIEVAMPLDAINKASAREKSIRHGHPSTMHLWWARRPLAACRAVLFGQIVDDPSSWPDQFPSEVEQDKERNRLFRIIEELVKWENSINETVIGAARLEIARSVARGRLADGIGGDRDKGVMRDGVRPSDVLSYLGESVPPIHDPFAGGGSIPLEAQRLGLRAIATDLNPIPVLINRALIEMPQRFAGQPPVSAEASESALLARSAGAQGLAADVRYYGELVRREALRKIGPTYGESPDESSSQSEPVVAWLWCRTVPSPDPGFAGVSVPLVATFWLAKKKGKETWLEPVLDTGSRSWRFKVRTGTPKDAQAVAAGTKIGRGVFSCILSGATMTAAYIREQGCQGRLGLRLMAEVRVKKGGRRYLAATADMERLAEVRLPDDVPATELPEQALGFRVQNYGIRRHSDLFTPRQLLAMTTFSDLIIDAHKTVLRDASSRLSTKDERPFESGGSGAKAYADAVVTLLAFSLSRCADFWSTLCVWSAAPKNEVVMHAFGRQTIQMTWDFGEVNPFSKSGGNWIGAVEWVAKVVERLRGGNDAVVMQSDAVSAAASGEPPIISTDPPYYDNVPYADLSDYFYVWIRRTLGQIHPQLLSTLLVPKAAELIAEPYRHGGRDGAEKFFLEGMSAAIGQLAERAHPGFPATIYYAFKQSETSSTGWETFLGAVCGAGYSLVGTWPVRTERPGRLRDTGANALASSIVLVCRKRSSDAKTISRGDFRRLLREDLPQALAMLQKGNIAPVDMAQASIGPGVAIFSRHEKVLEADGSVMSMRSALQLIHQIADEIGGADEGELDRDTRFAITWFETYGFDEGPYGEAETLATARAVSVSGVQDAGILKSGGGRVRIYTRAELPVDWDPEADSRLTLWEATQHLIKRLDEGGEGAAGTLVAKLGPLADQARNLAYRLYTTCERKGWGEEAQAYNGLVLAWPELEKLAGEIAQDGGAEPQAELFE